MSPNAGMKNSFKVVFDRSENDYCLYMKDNLYIIMYVEDLLILNDDVNDE